MRTNAWCLMPDARSQGVDEKLYEMEMAAAGVRMNEKLYEKAEADFACTNACPVDGGGGGHRCWWWMAGDG